MCDCGHSLFSSHVTENSARIAMSKQALKAIKMRHYADNSIVHSATHHKNTPHLYSAR